MAAALGALLFLLLRPLAVEPASDEARSQRGPHLTSCVSADMETFLCSWNVGAFQNLSRPGDLRLFFINMQSPTSPPTNWSECPHYSTERPNQCFFSKAHTKIWTSYRVKLCSRSLDTEYDEIGFHVEDIVQPDPPISLNWTLLNMSLTGLYYDVMVSWRPPESADVKIGWMTLQYEVQYRDVSSEQWQAVDLVKTTYRSLFGLQANVNHEVRVRCKPFAGKHFGEFSDSLFIHVQSNVPRFPMVALLIFGAFCLVAILMVVVISQQDKLMVILLPPVPGPKIRGIDSELLKKGELRKLTSILGAPPDLRPELYNSDPWVEFIDLDIEEQNDRLTDLDTDCLMDRSLSSNCSPLSLGFRDDDSGRASCCDPDLPSDPEAPSFRPLTPNPALGKEPPCPVDSEPDPAEEPAAPGREALYAQVSEVRASGKVLLSPEEDGSREKAAEKEKDNQFQLFVVNADHKDYASELSAGKENPKPSAGDPREEPRQADPAPASPSPPPPVYTVVEAVDRQNSLLLTPSLTPAPQLIIPKSMPTPDGYLTPELLGSITP
ncbi:growth hormone receptor-like [Salarias fasciatus]|uniref:Growth hormone receptor-like n=1 Tax=Salarias fasciatus TaxID=181472 RepID=A0A672JLH1_SALFA|nr:growth hormone receptor-like [Salarias fasciatus]XP_029940576.1 growth hormone receptor-like [Salarias fasciatus]XP_029940577.1 growth hormone receptor-like [Salarias fasciatus]